MPLIKVIKFKSVSDKFDTFPQIFNNLPSFSQQTTTIDPPNAFQLFLRPFPTLARYDKGQNYI